jgi:hypothetical protein
MGNNLGNIVLGGPNCKCCEERHKLEKPILGDNLTMSQIGLSRHHQNHDKKSDIECWIDARYEKPNGVWSETNQHLSEEVLIANSCSINIGFYNREDGTWYVGEPAAKQWIDKITHWMPLPENPHVFYRKDGD